MKPLEEDKPLKEKISISIDPDLLQELRKEALREERSLSQFINIVLKKKESKSDPKLNIIYQDLEEKMKNIFGTKVVIHKKNEKKGKIEIDYYSPEELDRIMELIWTIKNI